MNVEQSARAHIGWFQILQTVIAGAILLVATNVYNSQSESAKTTATLSVNLAVMKSSLETMQTQFTSINQIPASLARIETKLDEHERRIHEIEQTRKLK